MTDTVATRAVPRTQRMSRWLAVFALGFFLCTAFRAGWNNLSTDFPNYYTAAVATRKGFSLRLLYDWTWFRRQMVYAGVEKQLGAYTPQTPLTILPMLALTGLSPQSAKRVWLICDLGFLATTILLLASVSGLRIDTVLLLAFCGYFSLWSNFLYGQYYVFLLFSFTLSYYLLHRQQALAGGAVMGLPAGLKLYGAPFVLYFILKKNWRALGGMLAVLLCLAGVALAIFGWHDNLYYVFQILPRSLDGGSVDPYNPGVSTFGALLRHLFIAEPELNPHPLWNSPPLFFFLRAFLSVSILVLVALGIAYGRPGNNRREFAWFMIAIILSSTSLASYCYIVLLLPLVLLLQDAKPKESVWMVAWFVLVTSPVRPVWLFPHLLLLAIAFFYVGWDMWQRVPRRAMLTASACVVVLSIFASLHGIRAFAKEPAQNFPSVAVERGAIFSSSPAITSAGMFYQSMGEDRYILRWLHDGSIRKLYFDGDALLPRAVGPDGPIRFELVSHGKSSIAEFDPQTQKIRLVGNTTGLEDPESVQSPDGKWTAYTLPTEGWNQVWMRGSQRGALMQVTGGNCNSWSPAWELDSSAIIFASDCNRAIGLPSLYRAPIQQIVEHR